MQKVIVIGCPGSGKSTFARALHAATGLPLWHLDLIRWRADRTLAPRSELLEKLQEIFRTEGWIIDGNYASTMELRIQACDTVIFLDYPTEVCLAGAKARRGTQRPDMPWVEAPDEPEDTEFMTFIQTYRTDSRPKVLALLEQYAEKTIFTFRSREEADKFLAAL